MFVLINTFHKHNFVIHPCRDSFVSISIYVPNKLMCLFIALDNAFAFWSKIHIEIFIWYGYNTWNEQ